MKWSLDAIRKSMLVYAVTDRAWLNGRTLAECVQQAVDGGATFVQLREKDASHDEIVRLANELLPICRKAGVPFVIDDEVEIALEIGFAVAKRFVHYDIRRFFRLRAFI